MNPYIYAFIIILLLIVTIYNFYSNISSFIKEKIIVSQYVSQIKEEMVNLDENKSNILEKEEDDENEENEQTTHFSKITEQLSEIVYMPIDFFYKLVISYGKPIVYNISQPIIKNI